MEIDGNIVSCSLSLCHSAFQINKPLKTYEAQWRHMIDLCHNDLAPWNLSNSTHISCLWLAAHSSAPTSPGEHPQRGCTTFLWLQLTFLEDTKRNTFLTLFLIYKMSVSPQNIGRIKPIHTFKDSDMENHTKRPVKAITLTLIFPFPARNKSGTWIVHVGLQQGNVSSPEEPRLLWLQHSQLILYFLFGLIGINS